MIIDIFTTVPHAIVHSSVDAVRTLQPKSTEHLSPSELEEGLLHEIRLQVEAHQVVIVNGVSIDIDGEFSYYTHVSLQSF